MALIMAHPDLAGRLARAGALSQESTDEQAGAGLDRLSDREYQHFTALNEAYREKFSMPFIMAVKGYDRHAILESLRARLEHNRDREFQAAVQQVLRIGRFRIESIFEQG
jgi:2-oxo-4-hydroxy-4-carboxy-5-ureidoimidazoline decarboxylase